VGLVLTARMIVAAGGLPHLGRGGLSICVVGNDGGLARTGLLRDWFLELRGGKGRFDRWSRSLASTARPPFAILVPFGPARCAPAAAWCFVLALARHYGGEVAVMPFDLLADELLDRVEIAGVGLRDDGERLAGFTRASGAADAMDIVLSVD